MILIYLLIFEILSALLVFGTIFYVLIRDHRRERKEQQEREEMKNKYRQKQNENQ